MPDVDEGEEPAADASGSDNSEAALALLRALARADPQVLILGLGSRDASGSDDSEAALALLRALARVEPQVLLGGTAGWRRPTMRCQPYARPLAPS